MAAPKKILDPDYLFNILKLNKWFAIVSVLLLVGALSLVKKDYDREWKGWQRKFRKMEIGKTSEAIQAASEELKNKPEFQSAMQALDDATKEYRKREIEIFNVKKDLVKKEKEKANRTRSYQDLKSIMDAARYDLEEAKAHRDKKAAALSVHFSKIQAGVLKAKAEMEAAEKGYADTDETLKKLTEGKTAAEKEVARIRSDLDRLERKEKKIGYSFVNDVIRDAPLMDFIDPSLKVKELIVSDLKEDYNFTKIPRIDACTTCHAAIDKPGYENENNPLKTHPKLDLFLSSKAPHVMEDYGCTVCHLGMGGGLTFTNAGHTPKNEEQAAEWEKKYGWHRLKHWSENMLALQHTEATCYGCHKKDIDVPKGEKINKGIALVERAGCYGCHKIEGWENLRKTGPSLARITGKVSPEWMAKWIHNPKSFRPSTAMPRFFGLSNSNDPDSETRSNAEIAGIVAYLQSKAEPYAPPPFSTAGGSVEKGKELFGQVGCLGCHTSDDFPNVKPPTFAPDLSDVGSKLSPQWLAAWLKNPKDYWPDTRMPNLRLSDPEIRHLVAYLASKRNPTFDEQPKPPVSPEVLNLVTLEYLKARMPIADAKKKQAEMQKTEKLLFVGEKSIARYGCFGCHLIPGFENAKPIGTELTLEASKPLARFDFGFVDIEETVPSWIRQKLTDPRIFDKGKIKEPLDKLKMPYFGFTPEETEAVLTFVMGLRKSEIPMHRKPLPSAQKDAIRAGRALIHHFNCRGCHTVEEMGGNILAHYEDPSSGPPNLAGEGQKVQPDWLFEFLKHPTQVRPWLKVRMPTFGFNDEQSNTLIRYFRAMDSQTLDHETPPVLTAGGTHYKMGLDSFKQFQCVNCHREPPYPADTDTSNAAPPFSLAKKRLRYDWLAHWLRDPQKLLPGTRMPNFFYYEGKPMYPDAEDRITAIRDYLYSRPK